jgi:hypothetical protein
MHSCLLQAHALSQGTKIQHGAYGYKLLCDSASNITVSAIHSAGHVAAILNCMLAAVAEKVAVEKVRMLELTLCSIALICPAAACAFTPHMSVAAQESSTAAATAAVEMLQCACSLLRQVRMTSEEMQDVLSHVKGYARMDLSVAIAHILCPGLEVPQRLRGATVSLLRCMLGSSQYAKPFLHSCQDKCELACPAALLDAQATEDSVPVGQALLVGLLPQTRCLQSSRPLLDAGRAGSQFRDSTSRTPQLLSETRNVLESLLSQSAAATAFAVERGLHVSWADDASATLQGLGSTDQAQVCTVLILYRRKEAVFGGTYADCCLVCRFLSRGMLLRNHQPVHLVMKLLHGCLCCAHLHTKMRKQCPQLPRLV